MERFHLAGLAACGDSLFTSAPPEGETLDGTLDISPALNASFARGDAQFERIFTVADGLGPTFNQPSCETCHAGDGRGTPATNLTRFSIYGDLVPELGGAATSGQRDARDTTREVACRRRDICSHGSARFRNGTG